MLPSEASTMKGEAACCRGGIPPILLRKMPQGRGEGEALVVGRYRTGPRQAVASEWGNLLPPEKRRLVLGQHNNLIIRGTRMIRLLRKLDYRCTELNRTLLRNETVFCSAHNFQNSEERRILEEVVRNNSTFTVSEANSIGVAYVTHNQHLLLDSAKLAKPAQSEQTRSVATDEEERSDDEEGAQRLT